ncbi:hypothetical protein HA49_08635 [Tatumella morbirosei]|uniref:Uncharacterized protein n=1 Tax=Tatumella morbirosei TaxID=642227 RepID=A0A095TEF0_9GAMM|nr:hypothetical protein [Tatumella morbirosei]KGD75286.1 hypothetical protein HA49_08635 [Tatumella morbirosei]
MKMSDFEVGKKYQESEVWGGMDSTYISLLSDGSYTVTNKYGEATAWTPNDLVSDSDNWIAID